MTPSNREYAVQRSEEEWRAALSPQEFQVLRQAGRPVGEMAGRHDLISDAACRTAGARAGWSRWEAGS